MTPEEMLEACARIPTEIQQELCDHIQALGTSSLLSVFLRQDGLVELAKGHATWRPRPRVPLDWTTPDREYNEGLVACVAALIAAEIDERIPIPAR